MKKLLTALLAAIMLAAVFAGCSSPTDVFVKSDNWSQYTNKIEKGKTYKYETFSFQLDDVEEIDKNPDKKGDPEGKWVTVNLNMVGGEVTGDLLDNFVKEEAILLNGAPPSAQKLSATLGMGALTGRSVSPSNYQLVVYFDVPGRFDVEKAEVLFADRVKEK